MSSSSAASFKPRVPKKVRGDSKYYFGWKDEKADPLEFFDQEKQTQVELGRLVAHYLGETERAIEAFVKEKNDPKSKSNKNTRWPFVERVLNMYTIYKITKDMYDAIPDVNKPIPDSRVMIQEPGRLFGYSERDPKMSVYPQQISDLNTLLGNITTWIRGNLLLQYPIRAYKNATKEPIVLKRVDIIRRGASSNPDGYEFPGSVVEHYDILQDILTKNPGIRNTLVIQETGFLSDNQGFTLFPENSEGASGNARSAKISRQEGTSTVAESSVVAGLQEKPPAPSSVLLSSTTATSSPPPPSKPLAPVGVPMFKKGSASMLPTAANERNSRTKASATLQKFEDWLTNKKSYGAQNITQETLLAAYNKAIANGITPVTIKGKYPEYYKAVLPYLAGQSSNTTSTSNTNSTSSNSNTNSTSSSTKKGGARKRFLSTRKRHLKSKSKKQSRR